ncbi:GNAT family N-acetyltransferase [Tropicibacter naphthalenivorans]|uniref:L-ornithine N(alpha)-acyltransferase n=1 Tax=Tropicibacter naphthalenivorans TaxID=441103 RepID=A0A0P1G683_9RHOB|nr:GNAT family N-acetyltransferase [Tropicibacter naphthalenivorans]CUH77256.1 hypothetical protein TRN7648_01374 [Tropicibacter naphthalenivorans]SMC59537.1 ornithine-acyl[acyl carrier protein] N-acyltransferase [Tropicibacter naphthalenivorans]
MGHAWLPASQQAALSSGRYAVALATVDEVLPLRRAVFADPGPDAFDGASTQVAIRDRQTGQVVCAYRYMIFPGGEALAKGYAAQAYDLSALTDFPGPVLELGRFCLAPDCHDPHVLRLAWAVLTCIVDAAGVTLLCGCASFAGTDPAPYSAALARLAQLHLAPSAYAPRVKASQTYAYAQHIQPQDDPRAAARQMPGLLRTYLSMGGWVSDHAVIDPAMDTLHVFTGVEIARIPPARQRLLRALAATPPLDAEQGKP